jgi:hypothetical protein
MRDPELVPDLVLERLRLGELEKSRAASLRERLGRDEELRLRLAALEASDAEILRTYPADQFAAAVRAGAGREAEMSRAGRPGWRTPVMPAAVAACLLALLGGARLVRDTLVSPGASPSATAPGERVKGGPVALLLFRQGLDRSVERLAQGAVARPSEVVQIAYQAGGHPYGVILSIDGRGTVTRHLPAEGEMAAPLRAGGTVVLPAAFRLDDAPSLERFYFVAGDEPFAVAPIEAMVLRSGTDPRTANPLPLAPQLAQVSFLLAKEVTP